MSSFATIAVDETGKHKIANWTDWEPTPELRWRERQSVRLQQRFVRLGINTAGHVAERQYSWRTVPTVTNDDSDGE